MSMRSYCLKLHRSQRGAALLIMMLILFVAAMSVLLKGLGNRKGQMQQEAATTGALAKAKAALIAYVVTHAGDDNLPTWAGPGHLMCPDTDAPTFDANGAPRPPYGVPNAPCGPHAIGRLPHAVTLPSGNLYPLADQGSGIDQQFWYALANNAFNSSTLATLTLDGRDDVVAVILAPGPALTGQNRPSRNAADYLEAGNVTGPHFVTNNPVDPAHFNDKVIAIRRHELMLPRMTARVAEEMKKYLDVYHVANGSYPVDQAAFAATLPVAHWLTANNWPATTTYVRISGESATLVFNGCGVTYTLTFGSPTISRSQTQC